MIEPDEDETIDLFCEECGVQVAAKIIASHTESMPTDETSGFDPEDRHYHVYVYQVAVCGRCNSVFFVVEEFFEISEPVPSAPQGMRILYPQTARLHADDMPITIARAYTMACRLFKCGFYEPCATQCRKCLEAICLETGATEGRLRDRFRVMKDKGHIDQKLFDWATALKYVGDVATHDSLIEIDRVDARDCLDFLEAFLSYAFLLDRRFGEFKKRWEMVKKQKSKE